MRTGTAGTAAAILAFLLAGCGRVESPAPEVAAKQPDTGAARLATTVHVADPKMARQLVGGFHNVENGSWRWTQRQFTVVLGTPAGAAKTGATLELHLTVPPPSIEKLGSLTLTASIDGTDLGPETYSKAGPYVYKRDVPARLLAGDSAKVLFQLDKALQPGGADIRELGVVVTSAGLEPK